MNPFDVESAMASALTAKGSGRLSFEQLITLIEAGRSRGLAVTTVDATCDQGARPRTDLGFHVETDELERLAEDGPKRADTTAKWARKNYRRLKIEDGVEFEVWFWRD